MPKFLIVLAAIVLGLHGLIHLMGTAAYLRLSDVAGLPYKTTVLGGRIDLGPRETGVFGVLWLLPAFGFLTVAVAVLFTGEWWRPLLLGTTAVSLVLVGLDWNVAFVGGVIDLAILALLVWAPTMRGALS
jgi:hypothetical protein